MDLFGSTTPESSEVTTSRIITHLSRNLRSSLNTILGFSDMLIQEEFDTDKKEKITTIKRSASFLIDNIKDLLDFSYLNDAKVKTQVFYFSLRSLFENTEKKYKSSQLKIVVNPGVPPVVLGDAYTIEKIIENNLSDIMKFLQNQQILVEVSYRLGLLVIQIAAEDMCMISSLQEILVTQRNSNNSNIFAQFDEQFSRIIIAKGLADALDGREYMDVGRRVILIEIPVEAQEIIKSGHMHEDWNRSREVRGNASLCAQKIAIIDDDRNSRRIISWLLLNNNYFPLVLRNDDDVVEKIVENEIDLVLLELNMEGLDGFSINQMLKTDKRTSRLPVLICSIDEDLESMLDYGVFDCMKKPIITNEFMAKVNSALAMGGEIKNIIVVDPDKQFLSIFKYHLHWEQYNVFVFTTAEEALGNLVEGLQVDLAIIDKNQALENQGQFITDLRIMMKDETLPVIGTVFAGAYSGTDKKINVYLTKDHNGCVQMIELVNGYFRHGLIIGAGVTTGGSMLKMDASSDTDGAILSALQGIQSSSWLINDAIKDNL